MTGSISDDAIIWSAGETQGKDESGAIVSSPTGTVAINAATGSVDQALEVFAVYDDNGDELFGVDGVGGSAINLKESPFEGHFDVNTESNNQPLLSVGGESPSSPRGLSITNSGTVYARRPEDDTDAPALVIEALHEPLDANIEPAQVAFWFDATNGAAKLKIKGKTADGTVVHGEVALT